MKPPIWERQGRPKPPRLGSGNYEDYMFECRRNSVWQVSYTGSWVAETPDVLIPFPTFTEAIAYADREARR